jgi:hypothetical protein
VLILFSTGCKKGKQKPPESYESDGFCLRHLAAKAEALDQCAVTLDFYLLEVAKEALALTHEKKESTTRVVVVLVLLKVLGEVFDAASKNCNLNFRRTGVTWVGCEFVDDLGLNLRV